MINVEGQLRFEVVNLATKKTEKVVAKARKFEVEWEQLDTEDDKRHVAAWMTASFSAFGGDAEFTVRIYVNVFGRIVREFQPTVEDVTVGFTVTLLDRDGLSVEAVPINLNQF